MEAIVLAGGFGTRLQHIVKDVPKPMAPVAGKPFLTYLLDDLAEKGIDKVVLAVGYMKDKIIDYFGEEYRSIKIQYSSEDRPLFTGGAIKKAIELCEEDNVFVINGDTFFDVDLREMNQFHTDNNSDLTIAVKYMEDFDRYGMVVFESKKKVVSFEEKKHQVKGFINGGIYLLKKDLLREIQVEKFSFESDFMERKVDNINIFAYESDGYFIDIGIEDSYIMANVKFTDMEFICPVCNKSIEKKLFATKDNKDKLFRYFICEKCGSIFIDPSTIDELDRGGGDN